VLLLIETIIGELAFFSSSSLFSRFSFVSFTIPLMVKAIVKTKGAQEEDDDGG
jgi:hypothetical protein